MNLIKKCLKKTFHLSKPLIYKFISIYFDQRYLKGRYFDESHIGYIWSLKSIFQKNILRLAPPMPWPTGLTSAVSNPKNITFHPDDLNNFQSPGIYLQNFKAHIHLGIGTYLGPNVGIITANHKIENLDEHEDGRDVSIGKHCWIGMNCVILPGVELGDRTIVAAGSVVTKSFLGGNVIIGGTPARILRNTLSKLD